MNKTPILLYHDFCSQTDNHKDNFCVTWENFKQQMDYLHENGFAAMSLAKFIAEQEYWRSEETKEEKAIKDTRKKVVLTFDDGDISNYHFVLPILKEKGFTATFFVTINEIGKEGRMDWTMIYDLTRNNMDVGSHGLSHSFLTAHNNYTVLNELLMSKQILEKYTRKRIDFLSIPQGFYNKRVLAIAKDVGFKAACVSDIGFNDFQSEDLFLLKRFTMRRNYRIGAFRAIVQGAPQITVRAAESLRTRMRNMLGWQMYDRIRQIWK
ncbi:MAG: polysaccharide deacetylase family protein [Candidatus Omnitrophota bacterium]